MQPLLSALGGATCPQALRCGNGACTSEPMRKIGVTSAAPSSFCSLTAFLKRNSQGIFRTSGGSHAFIATFPSRHSVKVEASAATEDERTQTVTYEPQSTEADVEASPESAAVTDEESAALVEDTGLKANVKFVLQKECYFGQQFNVVGEIPELGEWDPAQAVPMVWSEGHVWSAEVPIPVGLTVKYKFVMTGRRLELEWQPGEDKVFETKDESDITASAVWADPEPVEASTEGEIRELEVAEEEVEQAPSTNGVATSSTDSDLQGAVAAVVAVAAAVEDSAEETVEDIVTDISSGDETEQVDEPAEAPEIPVVDAALATAVAEVSGEVEDAAAAEI